MKIRNALKEELFRLGAHYWKTSIPELEFEELRIVAELQWVDEGMTECYQAYLEYHPDKKTTEEEDGFSRFTKEDMKEMFNSLAKCCVAQGVQEELVNDLFSLSETLAKKLEVKMSDRIACEIENRQIALDILVSETMENSPEKEEIQDLIIAFSDYILTVLDADPDIGEEYETACEQVAEGIAVLKKMRELMEGSGFLCCQNK